MALGFSKRDIEFMTEPGGTGPTAAWEKAKELVEKGEGMLRHAPRKAGDAWAGMGQRHRGRWERRERRIDRIISRCQDIVWADTCPGCGEWSEGGRCHGAHCRASARCAL